MSFFLEALSFRGHGIPHRNYLSAADQRMPATSDKLRRILLTERKRPVWWINPAPALRYGFARVGSHTDRQDITE